MDKCLIFVNGLWSLACLQSSDLILCSVGMLLNSAGRNGNHGWHVGVRGQANLRPCYTLDPYLLNFVAIIIYTLGDVYTHIQGVLLKCILKDIYCTSMCKTLAKKDPNWQSTCSSFSPDLTIAALQLDLHRRALSVWTFCSIWPPSFNYENAHAAEALHASLLGTPRWR